MSAIQKLVQFNNQCKQKIASTMINGIRSIHSNRAAVCRLKRDTMAYQRLFPVRIVYKDGSTVLVRHQVPRELIKLPLKLEDCQTEQQKKEWQLRRKQKEIIKIQKDDTDVEFDRLQYLNIMKTKATTNKSRSR